MNDGGPAFPHAEGNFDVHGMYFYSGMTLRDYFAGQALIGKAHWRAMLIIEEQKHVADECYSIADAMLAARTKNLTPQVNHRVMASLTKQKQTNTKTKIV